MLSRLPIHKPDSASPDEIASMCTLTVNKLPVTSQQIAETTRKDSTLAKGPLMYTVRLPENNRRVVRVEHTIPRDDRLSGSPVPSPDSFSSRELLLGNAVPVLDTQSFQSNRLDRPDLLQWFKLLSDAVNYK
ncbi:hypothetical protein LSH36_569g02059 [Paralvinella palmiformis]|uniref:Uncharacterized protein n=1 Tax=Paralvinella palmiformis TaxID=53620 RepID=A0AAD9J773_9ANNE|nr:hypothetical protein LSH36_569g02059 [Paralvinella palmiformis]